MHYILEILSLPSKLSLNEQLSEGKCGGGKLNKDFRRQLVRTLCLHFLPPPHTTWYLHFKRGLYNWKNTIQTDVWWLWNKIEFVSEVFSTVPTRLMNNFSRMSAGCLKMWWQINIYKYIRCLHKTGWRECIVWWFVLCLREPWWPFQAVMGSRPVIGHGREAVCSRWCSQPCVWCHYCPKW